VNIMREVEGVCGGPDGHIDCTRCTDGQQHTAGTLRTTRDLGPGKFAYIGLSISCQQAPTAVICRSAGAGEICDGQMYYSLWPGPNTVPSFAELPQHRILSGAAGRWIPYGQYSRANPALRTRFADTGLRAFDKEMAIALWDRLKEVPARHGASPGRVALMALLARPAVSSVSCCPES